MDEMNLGRMERAVEHMEIIPVESELRSQSCHLVSIFSATTIITYVAGNQASYLSCKSQFLTVSRAPIWTPSHLIYRGCRKLPR